MIDSNSIVPMYEQLATMLGNEIVKGTYKVGDRLPCEQELSEAYSLSRVTVRHALAVLAERGLVTSRQGKGTFVADSAVLSDAKLKSASFSMNGLRHNLLPDTSVLESGMRVCPPELAKISGISPKAMIGTVTRLRRINKVPAVLERDYFPSSLSSAVTHDLENTSLIHMLEKDYGKTASVFEDRFGVTAADAALARLLQIPEGAPLVRVREKVFGSDGDLIYYNEQFIRDDIYEYSIRYSYVSEDGG